MGVTYELQDSPGFFEGGSVSDLVPYLYPISLNGRAYLIDTKYIGEFREGSIPLLRQQADSSANPSERSLNREELWRVAQESWHKGAGQCLGPDTRVLTADLRWVPCGDLEIGDELIAFEEEPSSLNGRSSGRQWKSATVLDTGIIRLPCYRILLSDGTKFIASAQHKWLRHRDESFGWLETQQLRSSQVHGKWGSKLVRVLDTWEEDFSWGAGYLAAAFDGEGCLTQTVRPPRKDRLMLTFSQCDNPMKERVEIELKARGFDFSIYRAHEDHPTWKPNSHINITGRTSELLRFLGTIRPQRLMPKFKPLNNGVMWGKPVEIVEVEFVGEQEVVALQTSTKTFIAEGFATHNTVYDRPESDDARFRSSKGIDVWTKWQLSLLPTTVNKRASANTNLQVLTVGDYLYLSDGDQVYRTQDLTTFTSVVIQNGEAAQAPQSITSNGYDLWAALGTNGIHAHVRGASVSTHYSDLASNLVGFVKGRLMAAGNGANKHRIYNVIASGAAPAALFSHSSTDFTWVGFSGSDTSGQILMAGYTGDKSYIYSTAVKADGTALDIPIVRGELDGEIVRSIFAFGDLVFIGTDDGIRFAKSDTSGNLNIGSLINLGVSVRAFEQHRNFFWFTWTNYDGTSTGLGRLDPRFLNDGTNPAYASDLMATAQGTVSSIATFSNKRAFTVQGIGLFYEDTNKVSSGTLDSGLITGELPDHKVAILLDVRHSVLVGTHKAYLSSDEGTFTLVGTHTEDHDASSPFAVGDVSGEVFEVRQELLRDSVATTTGPTVTRQTLMLNPTPQRGTSFTVPLLLHENMKVGGKTLTLEPNTEKTNIRNMVKAGVPVSYQQGNVSFKVIPVDWEFRPSHLTTKGDDWNGTVMVRLYAPPLS